MGVFELHNGKKYCLGSGVAPQTLIPLYPIGRQRCFWILRMGVFETGNAKNASNTHTSAHHGPETVFLDT